MATPIFVPHLSSVDQKFKVSLWLSRVGEQVLTGDRVVELLIPGITFDVEAPCSGTIVSCDCQPGAEVREGSVLGWIDEMEPDPSEELE